MITSDLKVSMINAHTEGGAAAACLRLRDGLLRLGCNVDFHSSKEHWGSSGQVIRSTGYRLERSFWERLFISFKVRFGEQRRNVYSRPNSFERITFPEGEIDISRMIGQQETDLLNLHWVSGMLDYDRFFSMKNPPIVWTLHDMNAFEGFEHFRETVCDVGEEGEFLLRKPSEKEENLRQRLIEFKRKCVERTPDLTVVTPSSWLAKEASESPVFRNRRVVRIPYGLDTSVFRQMDSSHCKSMLGLDPDRLQLLFVSDNVNKARKGGKILLRALSRLGSDVPVELVVIGGVFSEKLPNNIKVNHFGYVKDPRILSILYNAADAFILPSLCDNLPNTMLESLACGVPVIGFPIGGVVDAVTTGDNGILCEEVSTEALATSLRDFVNRRYRFDRKQISQTASTRYALERQALDYLDLFNEILDRS